MELFIKRGLKGLKSLATELAFVLRKPGIYSCLLGLAMPPFLFFTGAVVLASSETKVRICAATLDVVDSSTGASLSATGHSPKNLKILSAEEAESIIGELIPLYLKESSASPETSTMGSPADKLAFSVEFMNALAAEKILELRRTISPESLRKVVQEAQNRVQDIWQQKQSMKDLPLSFEVQPEPKIHATILQPEVKLEIKAHRDRVNSASYSKDGHLILTTSDDYFMRVWDSKSGEKQYQFDGKSSSFKSGRISPDGRYLAAAQSGKRTVILWGLASGTLTRDLNEHTQTVRAVAFSADSRYLATVAFDGLIKIWTVNEGKCLLSMDTGEQFGLQDVVFSPNGKFLVTLKRGKEMVSVWRLSDGTKIFTLDIKNHLMSALAYSPDGQWIATGADDGTTLLWRAIDGTLIRTLKGHGTGISSLSFSPDSQRLVTGSLDGNARVWQWQDQQLVTVIGNNSHINAVEFSPDGESILTAGDDGNVRVWELNKTLTIDASTP